MLLTLSLFSLKLLLLEEEEDFSEIALMVIPIDGFLTLLATSTVFLLITSI